MTIALVLVLGALLVAWAAPRLLEYRLYAGADPQTSLVTWVALVASTLFSLTTAVSLILLPGHGPARQVVALAHHCWAAVSHGSVPRIDEVTALLSVVLATIVVVRGGAAVLRHTLQRRTLHHKHLDLLRILTGKGAASGATLWLDVPHPMAYSVAGRPALVVASEGLRRCLPTDAVAAVLEHERAHLRGRHHLLVAIAEALAVALPWLPLMRRSPYLVRALVEVSADVVAARSHSAGAVRAALLGMSAAGPSPAHTLGMAPDCIALRLAILSSGRSERGPLRRTLHSGLAGAIAVLLPAFASATLLAVATVAFCPALG
ncbi:MAG: M56 family metallopeptidase [Actinomycetota bacterium]|nr:M56 family metallopeptidase [Actinomycetota bacterium]